MGEGLLGLTLDLAGLVASVGWADLHVVWADDNVERVCSCYCWCWSNEDQRLMLREASAGLTKVEPDQLSMLRCAVVATPLA